VQLALEKLLVGGRDFKREAVDGLGQLEVAVQQDVVLAVDEQHGDVVVGLDDAQQEVDVGRLQGIALGGLAHGGKFARGIRPNFHAAAFLLCQVLDQVVADIQEHAHQDNRNHNEDDFPDAP